MSQELSERRAADRRKMAEAVSALALQYDCKVERTEGGTYPGPRCIKLGIEAPGGLCVTVELDGNSVQPDVHVLSWHMALGVDARLEPQVFGGNVNPHHFRKATYVAEGFRDLMFKLESGLALCQDGSAYQTPMAQAA